ncbi:MAG: dephospho-CoA kinase [Rubrivivax sp.]|nr:dephospho-CoA kinase [Rubrivivax sp.]
MRPALRLGLTGGIGSGKSTVARLLVECGAFLVDTDVLAHQLTQPGGAAIAPIAAAFGPHSIGADGALDRGRMRATIFADAAAKARLEGILHPLIGERATALAAHAAPGQPVVFDVPLLAESSLWRARVHRIVVVDCSEPTQAARVAARPGWTIEAAERVIAQQAPRAARRRIADAVIHNDGIAPEVLAGQVRRLFAWWKDLPPPGPASQKTTRAV